MRISSMSVPSFSEDLPGKSDDLLESGVSLEIIRGEARHRTRPVVVPVFLIGSGADCDLVLASPDIPEVYAYLCMTEEGVSVRHLGEGPVLSVAGHSTRHSPLSNGDTLCMAGYVFQLRIDPRGSMPTLKRHGKRGGTPQEGLAGLKLYVEPESDSIP